MTKPSTSLTFPKGYEKIVARQLQKLREECGVEYVGDTEYSGLSAWIQKIAAKGEIVEINELRNILDREEAKGKKDRHYLIVPF